MADMLFCSQVNNKHVEIIGTENKRKGHFNRNLTKLLLIQAYQYEHKMHKNV